VKNYTLFAFAFFLTFSIIIAFLLSLPAGAQADTIRYAREGWTGDGTSWMTATGTPQLAIDSVFASGGGQVWIAAGTYTPGPNRADSFQMKNGVAIYGGFSSAGSPTWAERDWEPYKTVFSGDIGTPGYVNDNCYHVFYHPGSLALNSSALLDGITIESGYASGTDINLSGGGMYNDNCSPSIVNCTFSGNSTGPGTSGNPAGKGGNGGGMYNTSSSPTLTNCTFSGNSTGPGGNAVGDCIPGGAGGDGGAIYNLNSSPTLTDCTFSGNSTGNGGAAGGTGYCQDDDDSTGGNGGDGGAIFNSGGNTSVNDCVFTANWTGTGANGSSGYAGEIGDGGRGGWGGAISNSNSVSLNISDCVFEGNWTGHGGNGGSGYEGGHGGWGGQGGAVFCDGSSVATMDCNFVDNLTGNGGAGGSGAFIGGSPGHGGWGGGVHIGSDTSSTLKNCTFEGNSVSHYGAGLSAYQSSPTIINCTFYDNTSDYRGGGISTYEDCSPAITNCTLYGNSAGTEGGGLYTYGGGTPVVTNCILWGDTAPAGSEVFDNAATPIITYSNIQGSYTGTGNIDQTPEFKSPESGNFHLLVISPCIDSGSNAAATGINEDFEGDSRIIDGNVIPGAIVDMGVDESAVPLPDEVWVDDDYCDICPNDGHTWNYDAYDNIRKGIYAITISGTINVAAGTYVENLTWNKDSAILGSGASTCIIDGNNAGIGITATGLTASAKLHGFTVTGGSSSSAGGMYNIDSSPTISNCVFSGNSAISSGYGGGIRNDDSSPVINNCIFSGNTASGGGGL